jgi:hypothetical protein
MSLPAQRRSRGLRDPASLNCGVNLLTDRLSGLTVFISLYPRRVKTECLT